MKVIVVIGGIGSGKSTVSAAFRERGAEYIDLDQVGHDILRRQDVKDELARAFGGQIIGEDGEVVRSELAKRAFVSPEATERLNGITQPKLIEDAKERISRFREQGAPAVVVEISPYDGPDGRFGVFTEMADATVAVVAPVEERVRRASASGRFAEEDVRNRIARQATDEQRREWADYVMVNNASVEALRRLADVIWDKIMGQPARPEANVSDGLRALEQAYTGGAGSAGMFVMGAGILLAIVIILAMTAILGR